MGLTAEERNRCGQCTHWMYNELIEHKYGMGTGKCRMDGEAKGCDRRACLLFQERGGADAEGKKVEKEGSEDFGLDHRVHAGEGLPADHP